MFITTMLMLIIPFSPLLYAGFQRLLHSRPTCTSAELAKRIGRRTDGLAPLYGLEHDECIPDGLIVRFQPGYTHGQHFETIGREFSELEGYIRSDSGYLMNLSHTSLRDAVRRDAGVMFVETNRRIHLIDDVRSAPYEGECAEPEDH